MKIDERKMTRDNGKEYLLVEFTSHKAQIFQTEIELNHDRCAALRIAKQKEQTVDEFLQTFNGQKYTRKEVLKAWSRIDSYMKDLYKKEFPHGGWRDGGRPKGSKTDKTERLNQSLSKEEKELLIETLNNYRKAEQKSREEIEAALAPIFRRIDESFEDDEVGREKWRKRFGNINPMLFPQLLEYIVLFGIDKLLPQEIITEPKQTNTNTKKNKPKISK